MADKEQDHRQRNDIARRMAELKKEDREKHIKEMRERLTQQLSKATREVSNIHEKTKAYLKLQADMAKSNAIQEKGRGIDPAR